MKKVKLGFIAAALTLSVGVAFATSKEAAGNRANFNWQTSDASGNIVTVANGGVYDPNRTVGQAKSDYGCSGTAADCAVTVPSQDTPPGPGATYIHHN
ncbi:DUF6520 family protein [Mucilaginibacter sp. BT774]|uniref:DUF6520 family protein n=1 Tax=Mucilaginibacter sp. BT774 TaxID=3062276 RepID=UPI00267718D9|nr:DUF6520 family protein [Mucilaginibacter sp. BT774]MDO3627562.1 DUF6520 family protein [Mucilaginibacter sp. BT774]